MGHVYGTDFFAYNSAISGQSPAIILAALRRHVAFRSAVDIGCGVGAWTAALGAIPDVETAVGVDGDYLDPAMLQFPPEQFVAHDLTRPLSLGRRFDLAVSLEVAEHLPSRAMPVFVSTLTGLSDVVLFSAATPGQGGEHHVNERPLDDWRALFAEAGYACFDAIRPAIADRFEVSWWYRYNTLLFVKDDPSIVPASLAGLRVPEDQRVPDLRPPLWRLRCGIVGLLPPPVQDRLSRLKGRLFRQGAA